MAKGVSKPRSLKSVRHTQKDRGKMNRSENKIARDVNRAFSRLSQRAAVKSEADYHSKEGKKAYKK